MDHNAQPRLSRPRGPIRLSRSERTVLFLDNSYTFGGAIISLAHLVSGLERLGTDSVVASGQSPEVMERLFGPARRVNANVRVPWRHETRLQRRLRRHVGGSGLWSRLAREISNVDWLLRRTLPAALQYASIGFKQDVDLVHLNNTLEGQFAGLLAAELLRVPCVAHARGFQRPGRLVGLMAGSVAHHIAISSAIESNLREIGVPAERISRIHDAIDTKKFAEPRDTESLRRELGVPPGSKTFGILGRIVEWKGIREFVAAADDVLADHPDTYALVVGDESDGTASYFRDVRRLARKSRAPDRILFTGYRDDVPAIMQLLDVAVHASIRPEPFGLVVVEAMAAGTPVVAANQGGPLDIVVDGETGYLVDPEDTNALAGAITKLLERPALAHEMGEAGMRRARRHFDRERYARKVERIYRDVCG